MVKTIISFSIALLISSPVLLISSTCLGSTIKAKSNIPESWISFKKELKNRRNALTSSAVTRRLGRIHRVMSQKNSEEKSLKLISNLEKAVQNRPFDLANLYKLKASVYLSKDDFKNAFLYYNKALNLKTLPYKKHLEIIYEMASLHLMKNNIKKAGKLLDQLFYLSDIIAPQFYILKAYLLVEKKQKKQALEMVMKALKSTSDPIEGWLKLAAHLNLEMERYVPAVRFLTTLTSRWPDKKQYWKQLHSAYLNIDKEDRALATLDLAYKLDFLETEQEILQLTSLLLHKGLPFKAGYLLEKSIKLKKVKPSQKNYEALGDCWESAKETKKALKAYQLAGATAKDGKIFVKLGKLYMQNRKWNKAIHSFTKALQKGGIKDPEQIYISLGVSQFKLETYDKAIKSFEEVINTKAGGQMIKIARQWINHSQSLIKKSAMPVTELSTNSR